MQRRDFLKSTVAVAVAAELGMGKAQAKVPTHNTLVNSARLNTDWRTS